MKFNIITYILIFSCSTLIAQNENDIYRYSQSSFGGSARYIGLGGAMGAVGADLSALSVNPAGMGRYRSSEIGFGIGLNTSNALVNFNDITTTQPGENLSFNQFGIVLTEKANEDNTSGWRAIQVGFGYNRLNDFNRNVRIEGVNENSYSMVLAANAYDTDPNDLYATQPFGAGLAYDAWLIDPLAGSGKTAYTTQMYASEVGHTHEIQTSGRMGEFNVALSSNYMDKVYLGASVGFVRLRYNSVKTHTETSLIDTTDINSFVYTENLETQGKGINAKLGIIVLPQKWLRLGLSVKTPTLMYYMRDQWSNSISTLFRNTNSERTNNSYFVESPNGDFIYQMRTPGTITASAAIVLKRKGLVSVDYEVIDYGNGQLKAHPESFSNYNFANENVAMSNNHVFAQNLRVGLEYRVNTLFMLRIGGNYFQNGFNPEIVSETSSHKYGYSAGFGYRGNKAYFDFGFNSQFATEDYYMYDPILVNNASTRITQNQFIGTLGFKF